MAQFFYKAKIDPTTIKEGFIEADNKTQAIRKLENQGLFPIVVEKKDEASGFSLGFKKIGMRTVCIFTRQLANLLESGLSLLASLDILNKQIHNRGFKLVISGLVDDLKDGSAISDTIAKYPNVFSPLYIALIRSAEASGTIDSALKKLADFMEKQLELRSKVMTSLAYPLFILSVGVLTLIVLIHFVIPKLLIIFTEFSQSLPVPTQILINATNFTKQYGWLVFLFIAVLVVLFTRLKKNPEIRLSLDRLKLRLPIMKSFEVKSEVGAFCRSMSVLLENGVELIISLEITENIIGNHYLRSKIRDLRERVKEGESLARVIQESEFMPSFAVSIINIGEETGTLAKALTRVSNTYEQELEKTVKTFVDLLGPVTILIVGLIIGFIVVAMLLPIFQLNIMTG